MYCKWNNIISNKLSIPPVTINSKFPPSYGIIHYTIPPVGLLSPQWDYYPPSGTTIPPVTINSKFPPSYGIIPF